MTTNHDNDSTVEQDNIFTSSPKIFDIVVEAWSELPELILHCETIEVDIDDNVVSIPLRELRIVKEQTIYSPTYGCLIHITFV